MKRALVLLNTDSLGGAERSLILQLQERKDIELSFYIPRVSGQKSLELFIRELGFTNVYYYNFPRSVYTMSRKSLGSVWKSLLGIMSLISCKDSIFEGKSYDYIYLNGNKAAFYYFTSLNFKNFNGKVFWHLRDYWFQNKYTNLMWAVLLKRRKAELKIIGNSFSTLNSTNGTPLESFKHEVIYNPSGLTPNAKLNKEEVNKIGIVSMLAPWKGIHEIILWASMYESELKNLGIEEISIFGSNIYHTTGEHNHYNEDLNSLVKKLNSSLIVFRGQEKPSDIFKDIDLLIHYSLEAEPFGRVIIESFVNKVPVISTALGGAGEMVEDMQTGFVVSKYDKRGLFEIVKLVTQNKKLREDIVTKAFEKANYIEATVEKNMHRLFEERRSA